MQNSFDVIVDKYFVNDSKREPIYNLRLLGDLTYNSSSRLSSMLSEIINTDIKRIILNFYELKWIDSAGVGLLISYAKKSNKENFEFVIAGWNDPVESILSLLNFNKLVKVFSTTEEGINYFKKVC